MLYYGRLFLYFCETYGVAIGLKSQEGDVARFGYTTSLMQLFDTNGALWVTLVLFAIAAAAYLIGSLNFGIILSKLYYNDDIRRHGSKNAGTTNMIRTYGKKLGALTLLGDAFKAAAAVMLAMVLFGEGGAYISALFCMLGHAYPLYYGFKGGKGVVVAATSILCTSPLTFVAVILIFAGIVYASKYISLGSIIAAFFYPLVLSAFSSPPGLIKSLVSVLMAALIIALHKSNIRRLLDKTETKFTLKKGN